MISGDKQFFFTKLSGNFLTHNIKQRKKEMKKDQNV
jgi:hypothetical protein